MVDPSWCPLAGRSYGRPARGRGGELGRYGYEGKLLAAPGSKGYLGAGEVTNELVFGRTGLS